MPATLQVITKIKFDANKATKKTDKEKRKKKRMTGSSREILLKQQ